MKMSEHSKPRLSAAFQSYRFLLVDEPVVGLRIRQRMDMDSLAIDKTDVKSCILLLVMLLLSCKWYIVDCALHSISSNIKEERLYIKENGNIVGNNPDILIAEIFPCVYCTWEIGHFILIVNFVRLLIGIALCIFCRIKLTLFIATTVSVSSSKCLFGLFSFNIVPSL